MLWTLYPVQPSLRMTVSICESKHSHQDCTRALGDISGLSITSILDWVTFPLCSSVSSSLGSLCGLLLSPGYLILNFHFLTGTSLVRFDRIYFFPFRSVLFLCMYLIWIWLHATPPVHPGHFGFYMCCLCTDSWVFTVEYKYIFNFDVHTLINRTGKPERVKVRKEGGCPWG